MKKDFAYDEDLVVFMSDEWRDPSKCLKLEGAMPGNDVCADIRHASFNGMYGNGSKAYPYPLITVKAGKCYRMRWIMAGSNTENYQISVTGHAGLSDPRNARAPISQDRRVRKGERGMERRREREKERERERKRAEAHPPTFCA